MQTLPENIDELKALCLKKDKRISHLEEMVRYFKHREFGRKSERWISPDQQNLFNEAEQLVDNESVDEPIAEALIDDNSSADNTSSPNRKRRGRRALPASLERRKVYHDINPEDRFCPCGHEREAFDEVISEQLCVIPAEMYVRQHCRKKYSCPTCKDLAPITAPLPPQPLPKSNASPELLAHIMVAKYLDGLPFYRQEAIWSRVDMRLPRATMANWAIGVSHLLEPLMNILYDHQRSGSLMHIDETTVQVLKEPGRDPSHKSQFWLCVGGPPGELVYRYHYNISRGGDVAQALLGDFQGTVMSDAWSAYAGVCAKQQLTHIACNDHSRRRYHEAVISNKKGKKIKGKISKAEMGLQFYKKLYAIEEKIKALPPDKKRAIRQKDSVPIWDQFIVWIEKQIQTTTPQSKFGKALNYTYKLRDKLRYYCEDGDLPISNQVAENAIRPFAVARKNFLFFDTPRGAEASSKLYTLIMTAKHHGLDPFYYLAYVFKHLPSAIRLADVEQLLPWRLEAKKIKSEFLA